MIAIPDLINAGFEASIGIAGIKNLQAILRDKKVTGVHWLATSVAMLWGWYNMFYYPYLGQWASFFAGMCITGCNTTWLVLAYKYGAFSKQRTVQTYPEQPLNPVSR